MAEKDHQLTSSLQEAVLAVLAFDEKFGALIAAQVTPENFDGLFHEVAGPVLNYRQKYGKAPGYAHLEDLFQRGKLDPSDRKAQALRRVLVNLAAVANSVNAEYVVSRTQDHVRDQKLKAALLEANERYLQGGDGAVSDVEGILHNALRFRSATLDAGTFLNQVDKSSLFQEKQEAALAPLNIPELDRYQIGLHAKRMLLYIAPKNTGKSWFCIHCGRQALINQMRVVHVSCEMYEDEVLDRYYQNFFGIATFPDAYQRATLEFDELERLTGFKMKRSKPRLDFTDPNIRKILRGKVGHWGTRFSRLVIKAFPSGQLTLNGLRGYLDYLETTQKFIPNVLIVDYPDLMKFDRRDFRLSLGALFVDLRGLAAERNLALVTPTQSGRDSIGAARNKSSNVSEDISKVFTADTVLTYSQTEAEGRLNLGRITVDHARKAPKGSVILLAQSYATGQYVLQSAGMSSAYWDKLKAVTGDGAVDDE